MNLLLEMLPTFAFAALCMVVIIVVAVRFTRWMEIFLLPRAKGMPVASGMLHDDEWELVVDDKTIANLVPTGPPEDLNTGFIIFDVTVIPGNETEAEHLLHDFNRRKPDDERIRFCSRKRDGVELKDSQVLGRLMSNGRQLSMKAYPAEAHSDQGSSRPAT